MDANMKRVDTYGTFVIGGLQLMQPTPEGDKKREAVMATMNVVRTSSERLEELKDRYEKPRAKLDELRGTVKQAAFGGAILLAATAPELTPELPLGFAKVEPFAAADAVIKAAHRAQTEGGRGIGEMLKQLVEEYRTVEKEASALAVQINDAQAEVTEATLAFNAASKAGESFIRQRSSRDSAAMRHVRRHYTTRRGPANDNSTADAGEGGTTAETGNTEVTKGGQPIGPTQPPAPLLKPAVAANTLPADEKTTKAA